MHSSSIDHTRPAGDGAVTGHAADAILLTWIDAQQRTWTIELHPGRIVWKGDHRTIELPADRWSTDLMVSELDSRIMVRLETFENALTFVLSREQADAFFRHIGLSVAKSTPSTPETPAVESATQSLLWPKVSPLSVWALICSAPAFLPIVGFIPASATIVLLVLHRMKVRQSAAWRHSRALCRTAVVFLITGILVSLLTLWSLRHGDFILSEAALFAGGASGRNWGIIAGGLIVVLFSLSIHEAAHAITAWWLGDDFARRLGRVTINPLAHIDPFGTILLPLLLVLAHGPVFGYARPVPVRVDTIRRFRRAHILISLAGPGSNLLIACASLMFLLAAGCLVRILVPTADVQFLSTINFTTPVEASGFALAPVFAAFCTVFKLSFVINLLLALFNLIPLPPLDGSWVLEHLFPNSVGRLYAVVRPYGFMIFLGAIYLGLFKYLMIPIVAILLPALGLLHRATGF